MPFLVPASPSRLDSSEQHLGDNVAALITGAHIRAWAPAPLLLK